MKNIFYFRSLHSTFITFLKKRRLKKHVGITHNFVSFLFFLSLLSTTDTSNSSCASVPQKREVLKIDREVQNEEVPTNPVGGRCCTSKISFFFFFERSPHFATEEDFFPFLKAESLSFSLCHFFTCRQTVSREGGGYRFRKRERSKEGGLKKIFCDFFNGKLEHVADDFVYG